MSTLVNSEDPDEMLQYVAFYQSLCCLLKVKIIFKNRNAS